MNPKYKHYIERISKDKLGIETLDEQFSDSLDVHEIHVSSLKEALSSIFSIGVFVGSELQKAKPNNETRH